jgi:ABC-type sulfate transport system permease component
MIILLLLFLRPHLRSLRCALPEPRRWHLVLILLTPLVVILMFNTGLVALVWNRFGLHRLVRARRLSFRGCVIAGAILMCLGL